MATNVESSAGEPSTRRSPHQLSARQSELLAWIVIGCPDGVYAEDTFAHRISARALVSRGLVQITGHGASWRAVPTERGRVWPDVTDSDAAQLDRKREPARRVETEQTPAERAVLAARTSRRRRSPSKLIPVKQMSKQEVYMRYKVAVSRVQVAERWIRAADDEDAARKAQEEFAKPYAYFGHWETTASEVEVVEVEQTLVIPPNLLDASGPMMLSLKDAASAIGITYSALNELTNRGDLEYVPIGSRKYVSRESLMTFIRENTRRGYSPD